MERFPCTNCGEGFPTEEALLAHMDEEHRKKDPAPPGPSSSQAARALEFPSMVKETAGRAYREWEESRGLDEEAKRLKFGRAVRVTARYLPGLRKEVKSGDLTWYSDPPKIGGGMGEHPAALQHFIASLPLCQLTHYAERASVWELKVEDIEVTAIGRYLAISGRPFDRVDYEVRIKSPEPKEKIKELAIAAAGDCYVTNTLKRSSRVTGKVLLNGEFLTDL
jgi:uncharacterized OsmC-like protein